MSKYNHCENCGDSPDFCSCHNRICEICFLDFDYCECDDEEIADVYRTCPDCWNREDFCECGELPAEAKHDADCPCKACESNNQAVLFENLRNLY